MLTSFYIELRSTIQIIITKINNNDGPNIFLMFHLISLLLAKKDKIF